jgi:ankyrin repeat protein
MQSIESVGDRTMQSIAWLRHGDRTMDRQIILDKKLLRAFQSKDNIEYIKLLVTNGADVNVEDIHGRTALIIAVSKNHTDAVKLLIEYKADVNKKVEDIGWTPLMESVFSCRYVTKYVTIIMNTDIVSELVKAGAHVNAKNEHGLTALMLAAIQRAKSIVSILLRAKADPNILDSSKYTALMYAASEVNEEIVRELIDAGTDVDLVNNDGKTALEIAKTRRHRNIIKLIENVYKLRAVAILEVCEHYKLPPGVDEIIRCFVSTL